jgi:L-glutamine-phosphate cytidylyltransferase
MSVHRAIILAAGHGSRMGALTAHRPKALLEVEGRTLIDRQLDALEHNGIDEVTVVSGYLHERLQAHLGARVHFIENTAFRTTNSLYSLWLAKDHLARGAIVMNSDILVSPELLARLVHAPAADAVLVDPAPVAGEEEMKVKVRDGWVRDFGKDLPPADADGENVGIVKISREAAPLLASHLDTLVAGNARAWAPLAFRALAQARPVAAIFTDGLPWIEIDFPADLERARGVIAPAIANAGCVGRAA